jgi:hypothetical protein
MTTMISKPVVSLMLGLAALGAGAQSVYRCGNAYSPSSCPQARLVEVDDGRSEAQRSDAQLLAANDKRLGNELQRERLARDAAEKSAAKAPAQAKPAKRARATKIRWFKP